MKTSLLVCLLLFSYQIAFNCAQQNIILTSTLPDNLIVLPEQELIFTCVARGAPIVQWSSNEYISSGGHNIQILNSTSGMAVTRGAAHATLVSATRENGILVLVSELRITTSTQYPVATIQCDDNGHGSKDNITFVLQNVTLTSTLTGDHMAYNGQELVFTCVARGAPIVQWSSNEYISSGGHNIQILNSTSGMAVTRGAAHATLVSATRENGMLVLVSELRITTSTQYPVATIQCDDNGHGSKDNITFHLTGSPPPRINSTLRDEMSACPGDEIRFECETLDSQSLAWMSEAYLGLGASLPFSYASPINVPEESPGNYYAMLMSTSRETGRIRLTSMLSITVLENIRDQTHSVTCLNVEIGTNTTISFQLAESCKDSTTASTSTESDVDLGKKSKDIPTKILVPVIIIVAAVIILLGIFIALCVHRAGKHAKVRPCSCMDDKVEAQHPPQDDNEVKKCPEVPSIPSTSTSRSTLSEQKSLLKSPSTVTADSMRSGQSQGDHDLMMMSTLVEAGEEDNLSSEAASIKDIHMQDNSSNGTTSNKDVPVQELTRPCEVKE